MRRIWNDYKVWILIGLAYTGFYFFKGYKILKQMVSGLYTKLNMSASKELGLFHMQQLSLTGLTFNALSYHSIKVGEFLRISFVLDNTEESEIKKTVVVKHVDKQLIQVDFCHQKEVETALIRYLKAS